MSKTLHQQGFFLEQNICQRVHKFCQNLNQDKMTYLINYNLTLQLSIKDYTRQLHKNNVLYMKSKPWVNWLHSYFSLNFYQKKYAKFGQKVNQQQKNVCLSYKFTPVQRVLHQCCWWCKKRLVDLCLTA